MSRTSRIITNGCRCVPICQGTINSEYKCILCVPPFTDRVETLQAEGTGFFVPAAFALFCAFHVVVVPPHEEGSEATALYIR